jgi:hypothetical protein
MTSKRKSCLQSKHHLSDQVRFVNHPCCGYRFRLVLSDDWLFAKRYAALSEGFHNATKVKGYSLRQRIRRKLPLGDLSDLKKLANHQRNLSALWLVAALREGALK